MHLKRLLLLIGLWCWNYTEVYARNVFKNNNNNCQNNEFFSQLGEDIDGNTAKDLFGTSVALSADGLILAVGATDHDGNGINSGRVEVLEYISGSWTRMSNVIFGEASDDRAGISVSLSSDGRTLAIGAYKNNGSAGSDSGHVRVYSRVGNTWNQLGDDIDGESASDRSGVAIDLSSDGLTVAIGADLNNGNGNDSGHVRVYRYENGSWTLMGNDIDGENTGDESGKGVSLSSDGLTVAIGANKNDGNGDNAGHVRVYGYNGSAWTQVGNDIDGEAAEDESGVGVVLSADGSIVAIGAYANDGNGNMSGHVRVYKLESSVWTLMGSDIDGESEGDESGFALDLSADGLTVAIGAYYNNGINGADSGHVRMYKYDGNNWILYGTDIDGEADADYFGVAVALSSDASTVAIGAYGNDDNGSEAGHVRVMSVCEISSNEPSSSAVPTAFPSDIPSAIPSLPPSYVPSELPTKKPSQIPSQVPSLPPSNIPTMTASPSEVPSLTPSRTPSGSPSNRPSRNPSILPTSKPSQVPSLSPSRAPSRSPSLSPSDTPSVTPSLRPSSKPSILPTDKPSQAPSLSPSRTPSRSPSLLPSGAPSILPTSKPSQVPSLSPSRVPSRSPTLLPSGTPSILPTGKPSQVPSLSPSKVPSRSPSLRPSDTPSATPSLRPSSNPSILPTDKPSQVPSLSPSTFSSSMPTNGPSNEPSLGPSRAPSRSPSLRPSDHPSVTPSLRPSSKPSILPTSKPSQVPSLSPSTSLNPTNIPSVSTIPSVVPTDEPTKSPSRFPTNYPTSSPTKSPTKYPTKRPTRRPTLLPSKSPTKYPTKSPTRRPTPSPTKSHSPTLHPTKNPTPSPNLLTGITACVAVMDECYERSKELVAENWGKFRNEFPDRPFCLLQPFYFIDGFDEDQFLEDYPQGMTEESDALRVPDSFLNDRRTSYHKVYRDSGKIEYRDNWYDLCDMEDLVNRGVDQVALFVDKSGSMELDTVRASHDWFMDQLNRKNINVVYGDMSNGESEDWVRPFYSYFINPVYQDDLINDDDWCKNTTKFLVDKLLRGPLSELLNISP